MRVLSLFTGIGAHDLGLEWAGYKIVGQVEIDEFCVKALEKHWPRVPKWRDIRTVSANDIRRKCGRIDLVTGGFPCQDISTAGKQKGIVDGERSGLWREMWRLIRDLRPSWVLLENVPALRVKGADRVLSALEAIGYTCWPLVVGAVHAGAPHERKRVLIVGYRASSGKRAVAARSEGQYLSDANGASESMEHAESNRTRSRNLSIGIQQENTVSTSASSNTVDDTNETGLQGGHDSQKSESAAPSRFSFPLGPGPDQHDWEEPRTIYAESALGSPIDGTARRLARWRGGALKAVGNANPPQTFYLIGLAILECARK